MKEAEWTLTNKLGLHARPAAQFVQLAASFKSQITISAGGKTAAAKSILGLLGLGARQGTTITVTIDGDDEQEAMTAVEDFFRNLLAENEKRE